MSGGVSLDACMCYARDEGCVAANPRTSMCTKCLCPNSPSFWYSSMVFFSPTLKPSVCSGVRSS